jgi:excinuclease ABC subunit C
MLLPLQHYHLQLDFLVYLLNSLVTPEGAEIAVSGDPQLFGFVGRIQEETHRFAIEYGRNLRKKKLEGSELDKIEGIGAARKSALFAQFKNIGSIKKASETELARVIPAKAAAAVFQYFHGESARENI